MVETQRYVVTILRGRTVSIRPTSKQDLDNPFVQSEGFIIEGTPTQVAGVVGTAQGLRSDQTKELATRISGGTQVRVGSGLAVGIGEELQSRFGTSSGVDVRSKAALSQTHFAQSQKGEAREQREAEERISARRTAISTHSSTTPTRVVIPREKIVDVNLSRAQTISGESIGDILRKKGIDPTASSLYQSQLRPSTPVSRQIAPLRGTTFRRRGVGAPSSPDITAGELFTPLQAPTPTDSKEFTTAVKTKVSGKDVFAEAGFVGGLSEDIIPSRFKGYSPATSREARVITKAQVSPLMTGEALRREEARVQEEKETILKKEFGLIAGFQRFIGVKPPEPQLPPELRSEVESQLRGRKKEVKVFGRTAFRSPETVGELAFIDTAEAGLIIAAPTQGIVSGAGRRVAAQATTIRVAEPGQFITRVKPSAKLSVTGAEFEKIIVRAPGGEPSTISVKVGQTVKAGTGEQTFKITEPSGLITTERTKILTIGGKDTSRITEVTGQTTKTRTDIISKTVRRGDVIEEGGILTKPSKDITKSQITGKTATRGRITVEGDDFLQIEGKATSFQGVLKGEARGEAEFVRKKILGDIGVQPRPTITKSKTGRLRPPKPIQVIPEETTLAPSSELIGAGLRSVLVTTPRALPLAPLPLNFATTPTLTTIPKTTPSVTPSLLGTPIRQKALPTSLTEAGTDLDAVTTPVTKFQPVQQVKQTTTPVFQPVTPTPTPTTPVPLAPFAPTPLTTPPTGFLIPPFLKLGFPPDVLGKGKKPKGKQPLGFKPGLKALTFGITTEKTPKRGQKFTGFEERPIPIKLLKKQSKSALRGLL